jgi:predicted SprT family Zn-dependent metalloprotease
MPILAIATLTALYDNYNARFFENQLPLVSMEYSDKLTHAAGVFSPTELCIRLSKSLLSNREQETKNTLLHEMIHVAQHLYARQERPHGPYFSAQMARINATAEGEVVVTVTHQIHEIAAFEQQTVLGKIKKLLALSTSPNENEAYAAAHKAQHLMAAEGISSVDLSAVEPGSELDEPLVDELIEKTGQRVVRWKFALLSAICRVNYCLCLGGGQYGMRALGRRTHIDICRSYYSYFLHLVESAAQQHQGKGKVFLNRFREAMVHEIATRLEQQFGEIAALHQAEVISTEAITLSSQYHTELNAFVCLLYPRVGKGKRTYLQGHAKATQAGKRAGAKASIAKQIVSANRQLPGTTS